MLDKLFATAFLAASMGLNLNENPNSASTVTRTFMNSTEYVIHVNEEALIEAHSSYPFTLAPSVFTDMYIDIFSEEEPTDVYYWINQIDNEEEVLITFTRVPIPGPAMWEFNLPDLSYDTIKGIQFFQKKSLAGETFYISQPSTENVYFSDPNLLPEGSTALLSVTNGPSVSITSLAIETTPQSKGIIGFTQFKINNMTYIANNSITGITPLDSSQCTNVMMYKQNYTNVLTFTNGNYPRYWGVEGYNPIIGRGILTAEYQPYVSFTTATNTGISLEPMITGVTLVGLSFEALNSLFGYLVFPGITLGMLLLVPVILGLFFAIIKLVKKGG